MKLRAILVKGNQMIDASEQVDNVVDIKTKYAETRKREMEECATQINALLEKYQCLYQLSVPLANGEKIPLNSLLVPAVIIDLVAKG